MASIIVEMTIHGLTNEQAESEDFCQKVEQTLKSVGITAEINDVIESELDGEDSED